MVRALRETLLERLLMKCRNFVTAPIYCHFTTHVHRVTDQEKCAPGLFVFLTAVIVF